MPISLVRRVEFIVHCECHYYGDSKLVMVAFFVSEVELCLSGAGASLVLGWLVSSLSTP